MLNATQSAERMARLLSGELLRLKGEVDSERLGCAARERTVEKEAQDIQAAAGRAGMEVASLEAKMAEYMGQITFASAEIDEAREQLKAKHKECSERRLALQGQELEAEHELRKVQRLMGEMVGACIVSRVVLACQSSKRGKVFLEVAQPALRREAWRARRRLSLRALGKAGGGGAGGGVRACRLVRATAQGSLLGDRGYPQGVVLQPKALPGSAAKPEASPEELSGDTTVVRPRPRSCAGIEDSTDEMETAAAGAVREAVALVAAHDRQCEVEAEPLRADVTTKVSLLAQAQAIVAQAESARSELYMQHDDISEEVEELARRKAELRAGCEDTEAELRAEIAGVMETRQLVIEQYFPGMAPIQDCEVGDWELGECSQSCTGASGQPGKQVMSRETTVRPDDSLRGRMGADCLPLKQVVPCNEQACPVDCQMGAWSSWAACSRDCGGGLRYRTRALLRVGLHGGLVCGVSSETLACNVQSCQQDCQLGEWTAWGHCSRRCQWVPQTLAGHARRVRPVVAEAVGRGACPSEEERTEFRECNPAACPKDLGELRCTANQDILLLMDGSGSIAAGNESLPADVNFQHQKAFAEKLIANSELTGAPGGAAAGVRLSFIVFGGRRPHIVAPLSGDRQVLLGAVAAAKWPNGITAVAQALGTATQVLRGSTERRHSTVVILSDGSLRRARVAAAAAKQLRDEGARVLVLLVQSGLSAGAAVSDRVFCGIASDPCTDNVLRLEDWEDLSAQLGRFLAAICPVGFSRSSA